jgi:hypothetical protein
VPVPIPVVVPGVVLETPRGAAIPGEDAPPLTPAELLPPAVGAAGDAGGAGATPGPAPNAQLEDAASAAAITIVVIFMTSVSLFI